VLANKIDRLKDRALMLSDARLFFQQRNILEVDVPVMSTSAPIDPYIDLVVGTCMQKPCYFHSSPEYGMKRLIAAGFPDCYQISHVFRDLELGQRHNPEFTMVEWYRLGNDYSGLIKETIDFIRLFLGDVEVFFESYQDLFPKYGFDYPDDPVLRDEIFAFEIEPQFQTLTVVDHFPKEMAMLSRTQKVGDKELARRFECYFKGIELANGYHELVDLQLLTSRLKANNVKRLELNKNTYPLDEHFLKACLPDCCGVAVGLDRLMMLRHGVEHIKDIIPFSYGEET
jgi:lysyl-tRNA synthetase class 2